MKRLFFAVALTLAAASAHAADVGVSISIGQPGFYGRIDIGDFPQPEIIYEKPVIIQRPPTRVVKKPIYLHVPPGHAKNWRKHCKKYNACGQPVYFVKGKWYDEVYVPEYRERKGRHDHDRDRGRGKDSDRDRGRGHGKGHDRD